MPNVPKLPGVPALSSYVPNAVTLLTNDLVSELLSLGRPQWGLYKDGLPVVIADNVVSVDFRQDWSLLDYPIEQGSFETYDKVNTPFNVRLRFSAGGSESNRQVLLDSVEGVSNSLEIFDAVTPERVYSNVNVQHYDYRRTATQGAGLLAIDVWCLEIRNNATSTFSNTKTPSGASPQSGGTVQPIPATPTQAATGAGVQ